MKERGERGVALFKIMKVELVIKYDDEPDKDEEHASQLLLNIHHKFPEAVWQKGKAGYEIFI